MQTMTDLSTKVVTIIDNGIFPDVALTIAPAFKQCFYFSPWQSAFPSSSKILPGDGFDEMERVKWKWKAVAKSDLIVFPDVYFGDEQEFLAKMGVPVWGARRGEMLELNRAGAKELMKATGWQPHSVRGFLSGTVGKKMGLAVSSTKGEDGERTYSVKG